MCIASMMSSVLVGYMFSKDPKQYTSIRKHSGLILPWNLNLWCEKLKYHSLIGFASLKQVAKVLPYMVCRMGTKDPHLSDECVSGEKSNLLNLTSVTFKQYVCWNLHLYIPCEVIYMLVSSRCYLRTQGRVIVECWFQWRRNGGGGGLGGSSPPYCQV